MLIESFDSGSNDSFSVLLFVEIFSRKVLRDPGGKSEHGQIVFGVYTMPKS